jgi:hypothetical protein
MNSPIAQAVCEPVQHLRDKEEIAIRANLTIKYQFIPRSDLPESACRADCLTPLVIEPGLCESSREFGNIGARSPA